MSLLLVGLSLSESTQKAMVSSEIFGRK